MENALQHQWPEWPVLAIQNWLGIESLGSQIKFKFAKFGDLPVVFISTLKLMPADEILPWPEYPIANIQKHLGLQLSTTVSYEYFPKKYAVVWVEGPEIEREEFNQTAANYFNE